MLPPHVPHPIDEVIGIPFVNDPAFAFEFGWRTMIRETGMCRAK